MIELKHLLKGLLILVLGENMKKLLNFRDKIENSIIFKIFKYILYVLVVLLLVVTLVQKVSNNSLSVGGYRMFMVVTGSMEPEYLVGDILISKTTPESKLKIGDDVTYLGKEESVKDKVITHRLIKIEEKNGEKIFTTKGIANQFEDPSIKYDQIYGRVVYKTIILSSLARLMSNIVAYYLVFIIIALIFCIEVVSFIFSNYVDEDDEEEDIEEKKEEIPQMKQSAIIEIKDDDADE